MKMRQTYGLKNHIKVFSTGVMLAMLLCGCGNTGSSDKVDQFSGKNVGVILAWESDYTLTPRKDINLYRYDAMPDMVLALQHDRLDAIALDEITVKSIEFMTSGIEAIRPGYGSHGYVVAFGSGNADLKDDYNSFLKEYVKTENYADTRRRMAEFDGADFAEKVIEPTGGGREIRVAYLESGYPATYYDTMSDSVVGFDWEPLVTWANDRDYKMKITGTTYSDILMGVQSGRYDLGVGYLSELYAGDFAIFDILYSDPINPVCSYFMVKTGEDVSAGEDFYSEYE